MAHTPLTTFNPVRMEDIPDPEVDVTDERLDAFKAAMGELFAEFPPRTPDGYNPSWLSPEGCRATFWRDLSEGLLEAAVYDVCDTGIPNDRIFAIYNLIFT